MRSNLFLAAAIAAAVMVSGCASIGGNKGGASGGSSGQPALNVSPMIPAAQGTAQFSKTENNNTNIDLSVQHLADPGKLTPPANVYVVWVRGPQNAAPQNVGALVVDKNLNGTLKTTTPLASFDLFITAEQSGQVQQPSGQRLLWTAYNR